MVRDPSDPPDDSAEDRLPSAPEPLARRAAPRGPFTLASLLDLTDDDLAVPLPQSAAPAQRWEQLTLGVAPETGEAMPSSLRTGESIECAGGARDLVPGLDAPGAIEIPVYLAGRALHDHFAATPSATEVVAGDDPRALNVGSNAMERPLTPPGLRPPQTTPATPARWTKRRSVRSLLESRLQCADCTAPFGGARCYACGGTTAIRRQRRLVRDAITACITSRHRALRTLAALILAPGELTAAHSAGQSRRFIGPAVMSAVAVVVFAAISFAGSVRPRPDRVVTIGTGRTAAVTSGLVNRAPVDPADAGGQAFIREIAAAVDFVPVLFLPLMGVLVFAAVVGVRVSARRDADAALSFTAHTLSWFVLWWGAGVPSLLVLCRGGFQAAAAWAGVQHADGRLDGLPDGWIAARAVVTTGGFHSALLALGLLPWVTLAWRRAFDATWLQACVAGTLITAIPLLLLIPFA